jgi:MOSC domain-containing protein
MPQDTYVGTVAEIWRYPVKSMGGERLPHSVITPRGVHADRMWAVRDLELDTFTTARRWPVLLQCSARFAEDPADRSAGPGDVLEVIVTFPDGREISSSDPTVNDRLSELIAKPARLEPLPALSEKRRYRTPQATKADLRRQFAIPDGERLPDFSMFPVRKLAELARYATPVGALYDAYPIHVLTRASLRAMEERSPGAQFDVRRFRPNVVVEGSGAELAEFGWCGGRLRAPNVVFDTQIPVLRCSIPTRQQGELPAEPDVLRTINAHADRCLGVYADVATAGVLAVGEPLALEPSAAESARTYGERPRIVALKRRALRVVEALMPRGG